STLLRLLLGELQPTTGSVRVGVERLNCLDQQASQLNPHRSVLENFRMWNPGLTETVCRLTLARFLFRTETVHRLCGTLSGGGPTGGGGRAGGARGLGAAGGRPAAVVAARRTDQSPRPGQSGEPGTGAAAVHGGAPGGVARPHVPGEHRRPPVGGTAGKLSAR